MEDPLQANLQELRRIQAVCSPNQPLKPLRNKSPNTLLDIRDKIIDEILRELDFDLWSVCDACKKLGSYTVIRRLGEGTSRTVYLGRDGDLQRNVSVVTLKRAEDHDEFARSLRYGSEVEDLDVFIVVYLASLKADPPLYIRQYIDGQTLYEQLRHGRFSFSKARDIMVRLGKALDASHRRGFFHMNVKPSNILVDQRGSVFLSALSRRYHYFDWLKANWGSIDADQPTEEDCAYVIPEFFMGRVVPKESRDKSDQYLLGLLGYHMITGKLPMRVNQARVPKSRGDFQELPIIQDVEGCRLCPIALADSIRRMVSLEPSERFESVGVAISQLAQFGEESLTLSKESYRRVAAVRDWEFKVFKQFYDQFAPQAKSAKARQMFEHMDWDQQYEMLKEAILLLLVYCEFDAPETRELTVLSRISARHSKLDLALSDLDLFQTLLIAAFVRHDPDCENDVDVAAEVTQAWRKSLHPGIEFMKRHLAR
jgi:hypothetical protein